MAFLDKMPIATIADVYTRCTVALRGNYKALTKWIVVAFVIGTLLLSWTSTIQRIPADRPEKHDAWQNLSLAYNLSHHGVMSLSHDSADLTPSSRREPLPVAFLAFHMASVEAVYGHMTLDEYETGLGTGRLKVSNVFWAAVLAYSVFASIVRLSGSFLLAGMGTWFSNQTAIQYFNSLLTEPHAAALLTLACYLSIVALSRRHALYFGLAGVCFGALALTKAAAFYVVMVLGLLLFGWSLWQLRWPTGTRSVRMPSVVVFVLGVALTTGPWMLRNYILLNSMEIVGGAAPIVLMVRAEKNKMSWTEYRGSFYAWAPNEVLRKAASALLGFTEADLRRGGRLQRLNRSTGSEFYASDREAARAGRPQDALSFLQKANAERRRMKAGRELQWHAIRQILDHPLKHIAMSVPFLWRGSGLMFVVLALVSCYGLRAGRPDLVVYVVPVLGLILFYALATHFRARYGDPMWPASIVGGLVLVHAVVRQWTNRVARFMGIV